MGVLTVLLLLPLWVADDGYVWNTFFDPENPSDYPNQAEAEGDIWETLNMSAEEQLSGAQETHSPPTTNTTKSLLAHLGASCSVIADLVDEIEGEQEKEARLATWEMVHETLPFFTCRSPLLLIRTHRTHTPATASPHSNA